VYTVTEAQLTDVIHIALILVLAIDAYITYLIHGRVVEADKKIEEANSKLNLVVQPKEHV